VPTEKSLSVSLRSRRDDGGTQRQWQPRITLGAGAGVATLLHTRAQKCRGRGPSRLVVAGGTEPHRVPSQQGGVPHGIGGEGWGASGSPGGSGHSGGDVGRAGVKDTACPLS